MASGATTTRRGEFEACLRRRALSEAASLDAPRQYGSRMGDMLQSVSHVNVFNYATRLASQQYVARYGVPTPAPDPDADVEVQFQAHGYQYSVSLPVPVYEASMRDPVMVREDDGLYFWLVRNRVEATYQRLTPSAVIWHLNSARRTSMTKMRNLQEQFRPVGVRLVPNDSNPGGCDECGQVRLLEPRPAIPSRVGSALGAWNVVNLCSDCVQRQEERSKP